MRETFSRVSRCLRSHDRKEIDVNKLKLATIGAALLIGASALTTTPAEARWRGGGIAAGVIGGLAAGALIGAATSSYAYGPGWGYYGYAPAYAYYPPRYYAPRYAYAPAYAYAPRYYGYAPRHVRRVYRRAYYGYAPGYYGYPGYYGWGGPGISVSFGVGRPYWW